MHNYGILLSCLKTGKNTPIYKKDDEQLLENCQILVKFLKKLSTVC